MTDTPGTIIRAPSLPPVPTGGPDGAHRRQIAEAVNRVNGRVAVARLTLLPSVAQTTFTDPALSINSHVSFSPVTASAATELAGGSLWSASSNGTLVVHHSTNAAIDRTFTVSFSG